jgi:Flp pilus assembly protein TadD/Fe2+ transport system protein FeoA
VIPRLLRARRADGSGPCSVTKLREGESGIITSILSTVPERLVKLSSLGIMPGAEVTLVQRRPAVVLRIGETTIALDGVVVGRYPGGIRGGCDHRNASRAADTAKRGTIMRRIISVLGILAVSAAAGVVQAQTSSLVGKIVDADGKPVAGAEVSATANAFPDRVYKGASDKRGNFLIEGLLYSSQAPMWTVAIKAEGWDPVGVKIVGRDAQQTLYYSDDAKLSAQKPKTEFKLRAFAEVRMDFTLRPHVAEAEAPIPAIPLPVAGAAPAAGAEGDAYSQAIEKVRTGDSEASVDLFKKAIEDKPDDWERHDLFAKILLKLDRQGEATIQANKAAQLAPDKAAPLVTLADIYLARGLGDKAADAIAKAQSLEPENGKVLERAATVAANAGRIDEAIKLNERVLAAKPDNTEVLVALADLYNRNKQPKKAEELLNRVVALDPGNAHRTFYNLGVVIENRDDSDRVGPQKGDRGVSQGDRAEAELRVGPPRPGVRDDANRRSDGGSQGAAEIPRPQPQREGRGGHQGDGQEPRLDEVGGSDRGRLASRRGRRRSSPAFHGDRSATGFAHAFSSASLGVDRISISARPKAPGRMRSERRAAFLRAAGFGAGQPSILRQVHGAAIVEAISALVARHRPMV